jgi:hypothetical protein
MKRRTARILDKSALLLATLGLAGNAYHVPSAGFWAGLVDHRPMVLVVLLGLVGIFGALTPVEAFTERRRVNLGVSIRNQILASFGHIHRIGARVSPPLPTGDLGLHIWKRERTWRHPVRGVLTRVATYRLGTTPLIRLFNPPIGKGVVGLCWRRNLEVGFNVEALARKLGDEAEYLSYVRSHGRAAVMNLTWPEFELVKHRGAVFASPIRNGRQGFAGCISVDASHGFDALDCQELKEQMTLLCLVVGEAGIESA